MRCGRRGRLLRAAVAMAVLTGASLAPVLFAQSVTPSTGPSPSPSAPPGPIARPLTSTHAAAIEAALTSALERLGIPGLSAAVVVDAEVRWSGAFGLADLEHLVPATPATVFRLASVSKPITATAVLQLAEKGRLDLDAPIQAVVPAFPDKEWTVTARHLLGHQGGVRNWTPEEFHNARHYTTIGEALVVFKDDPLLFQPGTRTSYTSHGFTLLGAAVEAGSGTAFMDYLRASVLEPAGMARTRDDDVSAIVAGRARGYRRVSGVLANAVLSDTSNRLPGGGLVGTAEDLARFAIAFQGGVLLRPATVSQALTRQKLSSGRATGYGLGWVLGGVGRQFEVYHVGGQPGASGVLYVKPGASRAVAILANIDGVEDQLLEVARRIALLG